MSGGKKTHANKLAFAKAKVEDLFQDTTVSPAVTRDGLIEIKELCESLIEALGDTAEERVDANRE